MSPAQDIATADPVVFWLSSLVAAGLSLGALCCAFALLRRARLLEDLPTSKARSAAQGYVELCGHARLLAGPPIISPLTGTRCCWWEYTIERQQSRQREGRRQMDWSVVERGRSSELFLLADPTGECVIDPEGARVVPGLQRSWRGHTRRPQGAPPAKTPWLAAGEYRYRERLIQYGDYLHAVGHFRSQGHEPQFDEDGEVRELLGRWKSDRRALLQRFDANGDGEIDQHEWEAARRSARAAVQREHVELAVHSDVHILSRPPDRRPYILSTVSQEQLTRRWRLQGLLFLAGSLAGGAGLIFALQARGSL